MAGESNDEEMGCVDAGGEGCSGWDLRWTSRSGFEGAGEGGRPKEGVITRDRASRWAARSGEGRLEPRPWEDRFAISCTSPAFPPIHPVPPIPVIPIFLAVRPTAPLRVSVPPPPGSTSHVSHLRSHGLLPQDYWRCPSQACGAYLVLLAVLASRHDACIRVGRVHYGHRV